MTEDDGRTRASPSPPTLFENLVSYTPLALAPLSRRPRADRDCRLARGASPAPPQPARAGGGVGPLWSWSTLVPSELPVELVRYPPERMIHEEHRIPGRRDTCPAWTASAKTEPRARGGRGTVRPCAVPRQGIDEGTGDAPSSAPENPAGHGRGHRWFRPRGRSTPWPCTGYCRPGLGAAALCARCVPNPSRGGQGRTGPSIVVQSSGVFRRFPPNDYIRRLDHRGTRPAMGSCAHDLGHLSGGEAAFLVGKDTSHHQPTSYCSILTCSRGDDQQFFLSPSLRLALLSCCAHGFQLPLRGPSCTTDQSDTP